MSSIMWLLGTVGIHTIGAKGIAGLTAVLGIGAVGIASKFEAEKEAARQDRIQNQFDRMQCDKKEVEVNLFDKKKYKENLIIQKDFDQMQIDQKERALTEYRLVEKTCEKAIDYKGIKVENYNQLLLGHDEKGAPVFGTDTNYIIAGTTGAGKTRKIYPLVLNYLANQQGLLYICDLKGTDFKMFKGKKYVAAYVDELDHVAEAVKAFEDEFNRRKELFNSENCIDIDDYNSSHETKLRQFVLLIDEYADISDSFQDRNKRPIGIYKDIIQLARKCRAFGGRIVLGTQRPSVDVVCGTLKNNCTILGMKCINSTNSKIMVDVDGCERLQKTESLTVIDSSLTKIFAYMVPDIILRECISKLK